VNGVTARCAAPLGRSTAVAALPHAAIGGSGQDMGGRGRIHVTALTPDQILEGRNGAVLDQLTPTEQRNLSERTPLWFYVPREAEFNRGRLAGVGGRLVAETFHRAMIGDGQASGRPGRPGSTGREATGSCASARMRCRWRTRSRMSAPCGLVRLVCDASGSSAPARKLRSVSTNESFAVDLSSATADQTHATRPLAFPHSATSEGRVRA
jgi:hypothetical protein